MYTLCNGIHWIRKQFNSRKPKSFLGKDTLGHSGRLVGTVDGWARWHIAVGSGKHEAWKVQQVEQGNGKVQDEFEILMTFASRKQGQVLWFKNIIWNKLMFMHNCTQLEKNGIAHKTGAHSTVVLVLLVLIKLALIWSTSANQMINILLPAMVLTEALPISTDAANMVLIQLVLIGITLSPLVLTGDHSSDAKN